MNFSIRMRDGVNLDFDATDRELVVLHGGQEGVLAVQDSEGTIVAAFPLQEVKYAYRSDAPVPLGK